MTVEEFLAWPGDGTGTQYELVDGIIRAQDAPSDAHGRMHANIAYAITAHLRIHRPHCNVAIGAGVRPHVRSDWNYRIPDLAVTCTPNRAGAREVPDPVLLIEIISAGNSADTWDNVRNYISLPSVQEIVLFEAFAVKAYVMTRDAAGVWPKNPTEVVAGGSVSFGSIGLDMPIEDTYRGTYLAG